VEFEADDPDILGFWSSEDNINKDAARKLLFDKDKSLLRLASLTPSDSGAGNDFDQMPG
jgi:hypothetical protein